MPSPLVGFIQLQKRLIVLCRAKIQNGEQTERSLARLLKFSQPHIHNVLKGLRQPSAALCDAILVALNLTMDDLLQGRSADGTSQVSLLQGCVGPGYPWPNQVSTDRIAVPTVALTGIKSPLAARLGTDVRMASVFRGGETAILDQSIEARALLDPEGLYLVQREGTGLVRHVHQFDGGLFVFSTDLASKPNEWERVEVSPRQFPQAVRARVRLTSCLEK